MHFGSALLGNKVHVQSLVATQHHDQDRGLLCVPVRPVSHRDNTGGYFWANMLCGDFEFLLIRRASGVQSEVDLAVGTTIALAIDTFLHDVVLVHLSAYQRDQAKTVCNELIMQCRIVLLDLHNVDCHRRDLADNHSSQGIRH